MKRIILKNNVNGSIEPFTTLKQLFDVYPELGKRKDIIVHWLARKKQPCKSFDGFVLTRQKINSDTVVFL